MLDVMGDYARKWRFEINNSKSNTLLVASRQAKQQAKSLRWSINGKAMEMVEEYKYLGVASGKTVLGGRWNALLERLVAKATRSVNALMHRAGGSGGLHPGVLRRLWMAEGRPILEYAAPLWHGNVAAGWDAKIEAVQYKFCKAALGMKATPAAVALRMELKLESMKTRRRQLQLGFWKVMCSSEQDRVLARVFRHRHAEVVAGGARLSGLQAFKRTLAECGLAECFQRRCVRGEWGAVVDLAVNALGAQEEAREASNKSSLTLYRQMNLAPERGVPAYLLDRSNVEGARLMTRARVGSLWLMNKVARVMQWPAERTCCLLCRSGVVETTAHFLLDCPFLEPCRARLRQTMQVCMQPFGEPGRRMLGWMVESRESLLRILLGGAAQWPESVGDEEAMDVYRQMCGRAACGADKCAKNYLVAIWRLRESVVGVLRVAQGRVVREPASGASAAVLLGKQTQQVTGPRGTLWESNWRRWAPPRARRHWQRSRSQRKGPANFYVVFQGRTRGVFERWRDCWRSVRGLDEAKFMGFETREDAELAFS